MNHIYALTVQLEDGTTETLTTLSDRGTCLGEISLYAGTPQTATVICHGECTLLRLGRQAFRTLLSSHRCDMQR